MLSALPREPCSHSWRALLPTTGAIDADDVERDVAELELHRSLASEDVHEHLEPRAVDVDLADHAVEVGEGPVDDPHLLGDVIREPRAHLLLAGGAALFLHAGTEDVLDFLA